MTVWVIFYRQHGRIRVTRPFTTFDQAVTHSERYMKRIHFTQIVPMYITI